MQDEDRNKIDFETENMSYVDKFFEYQSSRKNQVGRQDKQNQNQSCVLLLVFTDSNNAAANGEEFYRMHKNKASARV